MDIQNTVSVIGSGTMGNGIAHVFSMCSKITQVVLVDLNDSILNQAKLIIKKNMDRQIKKNIINKEQAENAYNKILFTNDIGNINHSDLVIEAVKEDADIKAAVFSNIDKLTSSDCILASNTSSISINQIANSTKKPQNVIGMHFMNPVPIMKLVEIIKGTKTDNSVVKKTLDYVNLINKTPVECNDAPGFVSNRILMPMINEAAFTYMENIASVDAIDSIMMLGMGHPMGPLKLADLIGIDVCVSIMDVLYEGFKDEKYKACPILNEMIQNNKLGMKSGEGFYKY
ncbi:MAG: 3-hydroxybutyryl-CoA dehydrogenase [Candidatus Marinimicrobia bacterium]|nr:3-hydroxybutyryl-CoA dehydrogenase [Candidatus Neomarinimicrobiota bacterium]|tara:strand:- start:5131 stop:5988 length:858 start_codon:yes stop_codon:yes gene_type:complete